MRRRKARRAEAGTVQVGPVEPVLRLGAVRAALQELQRAIKTRDAGFMFWLTRRNPVTRTRAFYSSSQLNELVGSGTNIEARPGFGAAYRRTGRRIGFGKWSTLVRRCQRRRDFGIFSALTSIGQVGVGGNGGVAAAGVFHEQMSMLPGRAQDMLKAALAELASHAPDAKPDQSALVQLAEHLAIRFALERYEKGEVKVNAVRQMLDRMNPEIESLRKILGRS